MNFDATSFWIGFATATVFWWLLQVARPLFKDLRKGVSQGVDSVKDI